MDINDCPVFAGHPQWAFFKLDTQNYHNLVMPFNPKEVDVLFVDGDHTYGGALNDLKNFGTKAKRIFVHDTEAPDFPGVRKAVEEFSLETGRSVTWHHGSFGMAEIR